MTMNVKIDLGYEFDVKANASDVFAVLSDVPTSASFFPKVDKLVDLGNGVYRWEMEKIGVASLNLDSVFDGLADFVELHFEAAFLDSLMA